MKIPTNEAAKILNKSVSNFLLATRETMPGIELSDCWPEVDMGLVESIAAISGQHITYPEEEYSEKINTLQDQDELYFQFDEIKITEAAAQILDKLERKKHWGKRTIGYDTLRNHYCKGVSGFDSALRELEKFNLILPPESKNGPFSLNNAVTGEIRGILVNFRQA